MKTPIGPAVKGRWRWHIGHFIRWMLVRSVVKFRHEVQAEDLSGPVIWLGKHCEFWETPLIAGFVWGYRKQHPCFEMSSFQGYRWLGPLRGFLKVLGGFEVMRPKDLLRLKRLGFGNREELRAEMEAVNARAKAWRIALLEHDRSFVFYPEGTRSAASVLPFKSTKEIGEAIALADEGKAAVRIVPVLPCYGARPRFRIPFVRCTTLTLRVMAPIPVAGRKTEDLAVELEELFRREWHPASDRIETDSQSRGTVE